MTDLATALANAPGKLAPYKGRDVLRTSIAIRKAGDGLSKAMAIDPQELDLRSRVLVVLECEVEHHDYKPIADTEAVELKQVLIAGTATIIDADVVRQAIAAQREKLDQAEAAASGQGRLVDTAGDVDPAATPNGDEASEVEVLLAQHGQGVHDTLREGCPECEREVAAVAAEAQADEVGARRSRRKGGE